MEAGELARLPPSSKSKIRFKSLDLVRPTSNRTPATLSKYHFKHWDFLKCLLLLQEPRMTQHPSNLVPIYFHKKFTLRHMWRPTIFVFL